ncbi:hypothetical protein K437DRAFT_273027 [Tilletiaria anomala UBC 951]|uniref:Membrane-associated proteins in eicosanoid and glutathione metabolism n=1 Tax=Tilletiaria anomala (strain ATCC 24038 / CBS 436.72 / UBC 951) TaxID=1037660 RepID=A0A066WJI9_TILAU|nr:uncharacterized protein K437DRAFT_273027 [Tilletiaria anomala UBC 951]KDN50810.1 hypothetical protein K437DRAFT_273027 [Tilletiaria anomala UBC 951]
MSLQQIQNSPFVCLATVPVVAFLAAVPHWYSIALARRHKTSPPFDLGNPRRWVAGLQFKAASGHKLTPVETLVLQGQACQQNGFEHLPIYAVALLTGIVAKLPPSTLNKIAIFYVISRIIYVYLYLNIHTGMKALWRTIAFNSGYLSLVYIFFNAASTGLF